MLNFNFVVFNSGMLYIAVWAFSAGACCCAGAVTGDLVLPFLIKVSVLLVSWENIALIFAIHNLSSNANLFLTL